MLFAVLRQLPGQGQQIHAHKKALVRMAHRTLGRRGGGLHHIAAVQAHPLHAGIGGEQRVLFQHIREPAEPVSVDLFHTGDVLKQLANQGEILLHGGAGEGGVIVLPLLVLVVLGGAQVVQQVRVQVHGVGAVDLDRLAPQAVELLIKLLRMFLLLVRGEEEQGPDDLQAAFVGDARGEGVPVSGLALAGEGPHQVFFGLAVQKGIGFVGHREPSLNITQVQYASKQSRYPLSWNQILDIKSITAA